MKLFTLTIIAVMLFGAIATAADVPTSEGDKAMIFKFDGLANLDLDGYHSYGIGMRYYIADMTAIRGGLIFGTDSYAEEPPDGFEGSADYEENYSLFGAEVVYEKHLEAPCASVSPYWGVGGSFEMMSDEIIQPTGSDGSTMTEKETGTAFSIFGALGFEWAFTGCMTLGGEYRAGFTSWSGECEDDYDRDITCKWSDTEMGFDEASVYLSVYF